MWWTLRHCFYYTDNEIADMTDWQILDALRKERKKPRGKVVSQAEAMRLHREHWARKRKE